MQASASVLPVSVVILTRNEERNIGPCLESCRWCDDVHVLDSGSTDRTCEIARQLGVGVHHNPFVSFGRQRNWAIDHIPCKHPWQFHLDADERFTPELVEEMRRELGADGSASKHAAYWLRSRLMFMGRWMRHSSGYPKARQVRLFRPAECRFVDFGHGQRESCSGSIGELIEPYIHYNFSKGLAEWFRKHNAYSAQEAAEGIAIRSRGRPRLRQLFAGDPMQARRAMKEFSYFIPGREMARFAYLYLARRGFLDGKAGAQYCAMVSVWDYWTQEKIREHERAARHGHAPADLTACWEQRIREAEDQSARWLVTPPAQAPSPMRTFVDRYVMRLGFLKGPAGWRDARAAAVRDLMAKLIYRDKLMATHEDTSNAIAHPHRDLRRPADHPV